MNFIADEIDYIVNYGNAPSIDIKTLLNQSKDFRFPPICNVHTTNLI